MNPLSIWSSSGIYTNLPYGYDSKFNGRIPEGKSENIIADRRGKNIKTKKYKIRNLKVDNVKGMICLITMRIIIITTMLVLITKTVITKSTGLTLDRVTSVK